tara:strand:+ start:636 stop:1064 length:429 start_codon:yes stop_codon:yes gene_type:complete
MLKNLSLGNNNENNDYQLIGIVSSSKEFKIAWIINNSLEVSLSKIDNEIIKLSNGSSLSISHLLYRRNKGYIRLINNKIIYNKGKSSLISSLSNFDYIIQFSFNFFEFESFNIINKLKSNNDIQFANFVDSNSIKEKYLLSI